MLQFPICVLHYRLMGFSEGVHQLGSDSGHLKASPDRRFEAQRNGFRQAAGVASTCSNAHNGWSLMF